MRLAWIALLCAPLLGLAPGSHPQGSETYAGFLITEGYCAPTNLGCAQQLPRSWSADELSKVKQSIDEIRARASGDAVMQRIQMPRRVVIRRFTHGRSGGAVDPTIVASFRRRGDVDVVELYDRFFRLGDSRDILSGRQGYRFQTQVLLHELLHALDEHSAHDAFQKAVGFVQAGSRLRFSVSTPAEVAALSQWAAVIPRLERIEAYVEQRRLNRRLAMDQRPIRIPTMECIRGPAEAFAEIGSHLILDDNAPKYLPSSVTDYFAKAVGIAVKR